MTHGKGLAKPIIVVASITAGVCFPIGTRLLARGRPNDSPRPLEESV